MSDISDVDAFDQQQEKLLLEQSLRGDRRRQYDHMEMSDEEVMGFKPSDSEDDDDDDDIIGGQDEEGGEIQEAWGKGELYGADEIEDEEDRKLEAEEALKLQKKQAAKLKESDFLGEWAADDSDEEEDEGVDVAGVAKGFRESIPVKPIESLSPKEQYDQLVRLNPEMILMNTELSKMTEEMEALENDVEEPEEIVEIKKTVLRAYIGVLNAYFALFVDTVKNGKANMKDHIIMESILKAREAWRMAQKIGVVPEDVAEIASDEDMVSGGELEMTIDSEGELSDGSDDLDLSRFRRKPQEEVVSEEEEQEEETDSEDDLALPSTFRAKKSKSKIAAIPDYGEHTLNDVDQADKDRRKRDLRFYTAKIDKKTRGKDREEIEGDADLPYQSRWFERQQQLKEKQAAHIKDSGEHDLYDSGDEGMEDDYQDMPKGGSGGADDDVDDDFIASLKAKKEQRKADREAMHQVYLDAKRGKIDVDKLDENGKRAINYQILKNKGLTPHRKKENRNARVKKRIKYEKAKKKLASTRAVYKQPTGAYSGEKTGIKKNLARSTKFRD